MHIFKIINNKKILINIIYSLTKYHLHNIFFKKIQWLERSKTWFCSRKIKNRCKTIFIGGFIFKEYEDNRRDQMHWMGSNETCLLIISKYTHHLHEKIIIHHTIYIKKKKKLLLTSKFIAWCELLRYCKSTSIQRRVGITFHVCVKNPWVELTLENWLVRGLACKGRVPKSL